MERQSLLAVARVDVERGALASAPPNTDYHGNSTAVPSLRITEGPLVRPVAGVRGMRMFMAIQQTSYGGAAGLIVAATSRPIDVVLQRAQGTRREGRGWKVICPAHRDIVASLHVNEADDGKVLLRCMAGCSTDAILAIWGMQMSDLFPPPIRSNGQSRIVATYNYRDEQGVTLSQVVRYEPKAFKQRRPDGKGGWIWGVNGSRRVLYRLPEILSSSPDTPVLIVEGEKDADRLIGLGFTATTSPAGAGKWRSEFAEPLRGHPAFVLPDNDAPGHQHSEQIAASLRGVASEVRIVVLPGLPEHGDVSTWLDAGHTADELRALLRPPVVALDAPLEDLPVPGEPISISTQRQIEVTWMSNVERKRLDYIWPKRIARGKVTVIGGDPDVGKGTVGIDITARVSTHREWPDGDLAPLGRVMLLTGEDDPSDTIGPRLDMAGADSSRIAVIGRVLEVGGEKRRINLKEDVDSLFERAHREHVDVVIIDPLSSYLGEGVNSWRDSDMRPILDQLSEAARRFGIAVIVVAHLNKNAGNKALYRLGGSIANIAAARFGFLIAPDPADAETRVLACIKANLVSKPPSLAFRIVGKLHPELGEEIGCIEWIGSSALSADELLSDPKSAGALERAVEFLSEYLAAGPALSDKVKEAAAKRGVGISHALWEAKRKLDVVSRKDGLEHWWWSLPDRLSSAKETDIKWQP